MFVGGDHIPRRLLASTADAHETSVMQLHRIKTILDLHKASLIYICLEVSGGDGFDRAQV